ncbi:MAG: hypothetical protein L6247_04970 [Desulfobacteraceae bacterium]|nr:hypothetical protein [Desulfobacteraceae bacterium]
MVKWKELKQNLRRYGSLYRAKVPGGWLVRISQSEGEAMTFYPDPDHKWDGRSLP